MVVGGKVRTEEREGWGDEFRDITEKYNCSPPLSHAWIP